MLAHIRKAVMAGVGAGLAAAVTVIWQSGGHLDSATLSQALGAFVAAGLPVGLATWKVPNADSV